MSDLVEEIVVGVAALHATIEQQATEIAMLRAQYAKFVAEIARLRAEKVKLVEALEPFARQADMYDGYDARVVSNGIVEVAHLRKARAALASATESVRRCSDCHEVLPTKCSDATCIYYDRSTIESKG